MSELPVDPDACPLVGVVGACEDPLRAQLTFQASADSVVVALLTGDPPPLAWDQSYPGSSHLFWGGLLDQSAYRAFQAEFWPCDEFVGAFGAATASKPITREAVTAGLDAAYTACGVPVLLDGPALADGSLSQLPSSADPNQVGLGFSMVWTRTHWACGEGSNDELCIASNGDIAAHAATALSNGLFYGGTPVTDHDAFHRRFAEVFYGHVEPDTSTACKIFWPFSEISSDCRPEPKRAGEASALTVAQLAEEYGLSEADANALADQVRAMDLDK